MDLIFVLGICLIVFDHYYIGGYNRIVLGHPKFSELNEKPLMVIPVGSLRSNCFKGFRVQEEIVREFNAFLYKFAVTNSFLIIGKTYLTYFQKVERGAITSVSVTTKYRCFHEVQILISQKEFPCHITITMRTFLPGPKKEFEKFVGYLKEEIR